MDFLTAEFFSGLAAIVLLDLVLAGDNAIVIALAARRLPPALQRKAIFWGTFGAIALRILLTFAVIWLLKLPGLMLVGGLLLLPIAWKLLRSDEHDPDITPAAGFWAAIRTIVIADALMGLDNVLAIAGAAKGHMGLVVLGLAISVPLVVWGSTLILKLIERFPVVVYIGAAAIAWTAARMIAHDHLIDQWFDARVWAPWTLDALLVIGICGGGWLMSRRKAPANEAT
ncbi:YjbE family integral membrane protein [Luteibacter rhizovicinus]|uniref:YjbE family integral membrane protein n=1 Tax=Luteibacter rhizovicinus TaxID=242606 RepID=A0A4R3YHF9_9GAMM|nr:TerC family protein [Luteibacter rhizovicinus]TCV91432.1 YjbE family integral membrane protein [Luteibacter rhizovicinus]